jgi:hypothetical protein
MRKLVAVLVLLAGCQDTTDSTSDDSACAGPLGKPLQISQINAMTACCQEEMGAAHCLDSASVPSEIQPFVAACTTGGYCIPDSFLATGAAKPPATCTAFGGPAVCLSRCIPQVAMNEGLLRADTCTGADELCVPCTNPVDMTPTGACDLLTLARCEGDEPPPPPAAACDDPSTCNYEANCPPVIDVSTLPSCGADAHCLDPALAGAEAAQLAMCDGGATVCVPDKFLVTGGKFTPATCTSVNGNEGRCLSTVIPSVADQASLLPQDSCAATEKCAPCFSPLDGSATGACNLSCDPGPTTTAKPFAACCDMKAKCVPATSVPDDQEGNLSQQECDDGALCVPDQILANGPFTTCSAHSFLLGDYTGVCLSSCLDFGIQGAALARGNCDSDFTCAPCEQFGQPTGAPGCPM